jgi:hypothetical protein
MNLFTLCGDRGITATVVELDVAILVHESQQLIEKICIHGHKKICWFVTSLFHNFFVDVDQKEFVCANADQLIIY